MSDAPPDGPLPELPDQLGPPPGTPKFLAGMVVLRHRNFRLLWFGQVAAGIGQQFQMIAIGWHIYEITGSTIALGLVAVFRFFPFMTFSLVGGAMADVLDRRKLLMVTQTAQSIIAVFLVSSAVFGINEPWPIFVAAFLGGIFSSFDGPARQALVPNLVPRRELANALTINALVRHTASIIGPGIAGVSLATVGTGATFSVNAVTHLVVVGMLLAMNNVHVVQPQRTTSNIQRVKDGLVYARAEPLILLPLALDFITRALGSPRAVLPAFAKDIFAVGPVGLGVLSTSGAVGGIIGGVLLSLTVNVPKPVLLMMAMYFLEGLFNGGFGAAPNMYMAWVSLCLGGICNVVAEVIFASVVQLRTPDHLRGRTTALTNMLSLGGPQAGQFETGMLAAAIGPRGAVMFNGVSGAIVTMGFMLLPGLRSHLGTARMTDLVTSEVGPVRLAEDEQATQ